MTEKLYLTEHDAVIRFGLSKYWFQRKRWEGGGPPFIKVDGHGRVLYPIKSTDEWFEQFMPNYSTSELTG